MALWIDYATIALAAYYGTNLFHLGGNIDLANSRGRIGSCMFFRHITQGTCRAEVRDGIAWGMRENIVGNTDESILFSKHPAILTDKRQTVNIRVNNDTKVVTALCHLVHNAGEVLLQWLRIVGKVTISLSI